MLCARPHGAPRWRAPPARREKSRAQRLIVQLEGVFCEPASAAGVAGVRRLVAEGRIGQAEVVVCVLTGHGLKDPDAVQAEEGSLTPIPPELDAIRVAMGL